MNNDLVAQTTNITLSDDEKLKIIARTIIACEKIMGCDIPLRIKMLLLDREHKIILTKFDKFTVAEIEFPWEGYTHHFFGIAVRNPKDDDSYIGISVSLREAIFNLIRSFLWSNKFG